MESRVQILAHESNSFLSSYEEIVGQTDSIMLVWQPA